MDSTNQPINPLDPDDWLELQIQAQLHPDRHEILAEIHQIMQILMQRQDAEWGLNIVVNVFANFFARLDDPVNSFDKLIPIIRPLIVSYRKSFIEQLRNNEEPE